MTDSDTTTTVRLSHRTHRLLLQLAGRHQLAEGRAVTIREALERAVDAAAAQAHVETSPGPGATPG